MPETPEGFALSCLAIAAVSAVSIGIANLKQRLEWWMKTRSWRLPAQNVARCVTTFVSSTLHFALMLLAMTFDTGVFFAVVGGLALGSLLFGHFGQRPSWASNCVWRLCEGRCDGGADVDAMETELTDEPDAGSASAKPEAQCH